eukprot:CAMPEP_0182880190 /NCGR_PEP_ID=MMETSP0034_2-20130328/16425_1 /TAXON_ID=156128 /ORGANISM="Nephroselmis pyriformis, Strain CCMP717" /LENGTH=56 /DNA_ID=CAMNT_0025013169 /DNA_START=1 /DNA_END=167 /DNA_ORIENTATION=+
MGELVAEVEARESELNSHVATLEAALRRVDAEKVAAEQRASELMASLESLTRDHAA